MATLWPLEDGRACIVPGVGRVVKATPPGNIPAKFDQMDPSDVDILAFDFAVLAFPGDPIVAASISSEPPLLTIGTPVLFGTLVQSFVGPATGPAETYDINCVATFASGRILDWGAECSVSLR
jgi:hypothetical protein